MTDYDFDRTARLWLEDGPTELSDRALTAALDEIHLSPQRRAWWPARRYPLMSNTVRIAAGVAAIALATVAGVALLSGGGIGAAPSPRPTPTPLALPAAERPGPVEAGTYVAGDPFPVRVTVTLPAGWNGNIGGPYGVFLEQAQGPGAVSFEIFDKVYADPCHYDKGPLSPLPGPSVNELATALASLPGIEATTPTDVTVAGYQGKQLTLTAPASFAGCTLGPKYTSVIWALPLGATFEMVPGQRTRVWILNVAGQRLVIDSPDLTGQPEAQAQVQAVLDSIHLEPRN